MITIFRYLRVAKPILTAEEYEQTEAAVKELLDENGPKLQQFLLAK